MSIKIDGKDYDENLLPEPVKRHIMARQEVQQNRVRIEMEMEKIDVLTNYFNGKIVEGLKDYKEPEVKKDKE